VTKDRTPSTFRERRLKTTEKAFFDRDVKSHVQCGFHVIIVAYTPGAMILVV
jgi:hypothetical protein